MRTGRRRHRQLGTGLAGGSDHSAPAPLEAKIAPGVLTTVAMNEGSSQAGALRGERLRKVSAEGSNPKDVSSSGLRQESGGIQETGADSAWAFCSSDQASVHQGWARQLPHCPAR